MNKFLIKRLPDAMDLPLPQRMSAAAAGLDLYANIKYNVIIKKGGRALVPTGISVALPSGYEAQIRPRSGLAHKHGITVLNSPGTVDADYRGELSVLLINLDDWDYVVKRGDRIAQLVISRVEKVDFEEVDELPESERGSGGYGSSDELAKRTEL